MNPISDTTFQMEKETLYQRQKRDAYIAILDFVIRRLLDNQVRRGYEVDLSESEFLALTKQAMQHISQEPTCLMLDLQEPLHVVGDLCGQYHDLLRIFDFFGHPPRKRYLFLGNYCDIGSQPLELIALLFVYKLRYPNCIYMLRGNHDCEFLTRNYGFLTRCCKRYSKRIWSAVINAFKHLPAVAIVEDSVFCVHSGLPSCLGQQDIVTRDQLLMYISDRIRRPNSLVTNPVFTQLTWSEPMVDVTGMRTNPVGLGHTFGEDIIERFCEQFGFDVIIRSHDMIQAGYEFMANQKLLTIFSAANMYGYFANEGSCVLLSMSENGENIEGEVKILKPVPHLRRPHAPLLIRDADDSVHPQNRDNVPMTANELKINVMRRTEYFPW